MKKIIYLVVMLMMISVFPTPSVQAKIHHEEMRGVWIATVSNIDFPKTKDSAYAQMQEFENYLDELVDIGINTVIVQVRPKADALYTSNINPWSDVLTGVQGQYPGYDPLAFMIEEAHERGLSFHAWLNPYRVTQAGTPLESLVPNHPARLNPEWTMTYKDAIYYNPEVEEVKVHIEETVRELVANYDIDGIHFDDYFYPYNYPLPEGETPDGVVGDMRRWHITDMVKRVSEVVEDTNEDVLFGISPFGIWKNDKFDPDGSATTGGESYYSVYADTKDWVENEYIDYIVPQIYWEIGHKAADYETLVSWWNDVVKGTDVKLYIGQGIYKDTVASEIGQQLQMNENYSRVDGSVYFSLKDLLINRGNSATQIQAFYEGEMVPEPEIPEPELPEPELPEPEFPEPELPEPEIPDVEDEEIFMQTEVVMGEGISQASNLNVRKGPNTRYASVGKIQENEVVQLFGQKDGWYYIQSQNGVEGFVSGDYIEVTSKNSSKIELMIDGRYIRPTVAPKLTDGTTLVPLRIISENLGAQVDWNNETKTITIEKAGTTIILVIDSTTILINDEVATMSLAPQIISGTTMVPIRFVSENLGAQVDWNGKLQLISIEMQ